MALSRRFKNLIVDSPPSGGKWLRCVDLKQLFNDTAPSTIGDPSKSPAVQDLPSQTPVSDSCNQAEATAKSEEIQISHPIFKLEQHNSRYEIHCFPLSGGRVAISDNSGRTLFYDANSGNMMTMPTLHKPKRNPISLFVPSADADDHPIGAGSLYIMERDPEPEKIGSTKLSDQFEALVCRKPSRTYGNPWHCQPLLPPPFVREPTLGRRKNIISYGVVGSNIFISTMCNDSCLLDTVSNTWTRVGKVVLPYYGKIEYVPELNLWFGLSAEEGHLAAADISTMDSQPQLVGEWKDFDPPAGWQEYDYPQLVNLGSGKFCTARFFQTSSVGGGIDRIAVFTGVEVMQVMHDGHCNGSKNGEVKLVMEKHKTRFHVSNGTTVTAIF